VVSILWVSSEFMIAFASEITTEISSQKTTPVVTQSHFLEIFPSSDGAKINMRESISSYLNRAYIEITKLKEKGSIPKKTIHIVLGNQSADMDSIASAIAFSYSYSMNGFYIPVINIRREDLVLRADVLHVFKTLNINPEFFLYREDFDFLLTLAQQGYLRVTLVDHNRLSPDQEIFKGYVEKIIDHHREKNSTYPLLKEEDKMILTIGSNATLTAKSIMESALNISSEEAYLLLCAILLDTSNLKSNLVTTKGDIAVASFLKKAAGSYYNDTLFDDLVRYRNAVEHLTPELLLKKDCKIYEEGKLLYGIASIPRGILWTPSNRSNWKESLKHCLEKEQIHLLSAFALEGVDRVWIVYIPSLSLQEAFLDHIEQTRALNELLKPNGYFPDENLFFFKLKNPIGRKHLQPLLLFERSSFIQNALP
jgi:inorganic pyrophosphatase/exopolyphosphatase